MSLNKSNLQHPPSHRKKILLMLMPFWDPQIPPLGISCLKSFIQQKENGYKLKTIDVNIRETSREMYGKYFEILEKSIPAGKRRHLYNIGHEVLRNHAMAHLHYENKKEYMELVKALIFNTFYSHTPDRVVIELSKIIDDFFNELGKYLLDLMEKERPSVLGLSVYSDTLPASLLAFKLAKERYPDILTVMGGGIFSSELAPDSDNFDFFLKKNPIHR